MATTVKQELALGLSRLREHWLNQAEISFRRILAEYPEHAGALHLLGVTLCRLGQHGEGIDLFRRAAALRPDHGPIWHDLAVGLRSGGAVQEARQAFERACQLLPEVRQWPSVGSPEAEAYSVERLEHAFKFVDYEYRPKMRYGGGLPSHQGLFALLDARRSSYADRLRRIGAFHADFDRIEQHGSYSDSTPFWINTWFPPLDAMTLYEALCHGNPKRYVEVGSGMSTKFARMAISDHQLETIVVSIDPAPRNQIDSLADQIVREPFETSDLGLMDQLEPGDILFIDSSHRAFQNSDVTVFFLDVLPRLAPGVLVHIHDIYLPDDYIAGHLYRGWNEQYLLATALLSGGDRFEPLMPCWFVSRNPDLAVLKNQLLRRGALSNLSIHGASFWFRKTAVQ